MNGKLKAIAGTVFAVIVVWVILLLAEGAIHGGAWIGERIYPWLAKIAGVTLAIVVFVFVPMIAFRRTRPIAGVCMIAASFVFGITLWFYGLLLSYNIWGVFAVFIGLVLLGVGVVPVAILATLVKGMWPTLGQLLLLTAITFGARLAGAWAANKDE